MELKYCLDWLLAQVDQLHLELLAITPICGDCCTSNGPQQNRMINAVHQIVRAFPVYVRDERLWQAEQHNQNFVAVAAPSSYDSQISGATTRDDQEGQLRKKPKVSSGFT